MRQTQAANLATRSEANRKPASISAATRRQATSNAFTHCAATSNVAFSKAISNTAGRCKPRRSTANDWAGNCSAGMPLREVR